MGKKQQKIIPQQTLRSSKTEISFINDEKKHVGGFFKQSS